MEQKDTLKSELFRNPHNDCVYIKVWRYVFTDGRRYKEGILLKISEETLYPVRESEDYAQLRVREDSDIFVTRICNEVESPMLESQCQLKF